MPAAPVTGIFSKKYPAVLLPALPEYYYRNIILINTRKSSIDIPIVTAIKSNR